MWAQKLANLTCALSSAIASVAHAGALLLSKAPVNTFNPALNCWTESRYSQSGSFKHEDTIRGGFNELIPGAMMYSTIKNALFNGTLAEASSEARLTLALAGWDVQVAVASTAHAARVPRDLWRQTWLRVWCQMCKWILKEKQGRCSSLAQNSTDSNLPVGRLLVKISRKDFTHTRRARQLNKEWLILFGN